MQLYKIQFPQYICFYILSKVNVYHPYVPTILVKAIHFETLCMYIAMRPIQTALLAIYDVR